MDSLIPVMNKLYDVFNVIGSNSVQLPQIVVIGSQSSGKSSVLEGLVGRDFLPRGNGIVTRCPLILQLIYAPKDTFVSYNESASLHLEEWGQFLHTGNKIFSDFREIRNEIVVEMERKSGSNKGISSEAISLKIFSPNMVNLTLVDLPGITKVPVGDQPQNIETQVKELIIRYISNPNAIILAVTAANTDFVTSEAVKLARDCDAEGKRTLAVITKLDLMDRGTNATDVLCGRVIPVKLGIIGVVNRSQQDIIDDKNINDAIKDEASFFERNYPALASRNGTQYLRKMLNKLLINHIRNCLPGLKSRVYNMTTEYESLLKSYGNITIDQNRLLLQIITKFSLSYCSTVEGTAANIETSELSGGARICYIFHEVFGQTLNSIDPLSGVTSRDILTAIRNATGTRPPFFVPVMAFELLVKRQIQKLLGPSLRCVQLVYEEMQRIVQHCGAEFDQEICRYPRLHEKIVDVVTQLLQQRLPVTNAMIENLVSIELAYINSRHPDFYHTSAPFHGIGEQNVVKADSNMHLTNISSAADILLNSICETKPSLTTEPLELFDTARDVKSNLTGSNISAGKIGEDVFTDLMANVSQNSFVPSTTFMQYKIGDPIKDESFTAQAMTFFCNPGSLHTTEISNNTQNPTVVESKECKIIEYLIRSYFMIAKKNILDTVPKAIMYLLVNHVKDNLQSELTANLYKPENFSSLLQESEEISSGRKEATEMLQVLEKASEIIRYIRDCLMNPSMQ